MIRAIQLSNKRTASTFLQNAINTHPDIVGIDEVFINTARMGTRKSGFVPFINSDVDTPKEYINDILYKTHPNKNFAFKLMYNQVYYHDGLVDVIKKSNIPIIHIMRRNLVRQVVSFIKMFENNNHPIGISPKDFFTLVEDAHYGNNFMANEFKDQIKLTLYYEDMIGSCDDDKTYLATEANMKVCNFFDVSYKRLYSKTKKKLKADLSTYLPNIKEIEKILEGTRYEWMTKENY